MSYELARTVKRWTHAAGTVAFDWTDSILKRVQDIAYSASFSWLPFSSKWSKEDRIPLRILSPKIKEGVTPPPEEGNKGWCENLALRALLVLRTLRPSTSFRHLSGREEVSAHSECLARSGLVQESLFSCAKLWFVQKFDRLFFSDV